MRQSRHLFGIGLWRVCLLAALIGGMSPARLVQAQPAPESEPPKTSLTDSDAFYQPDQVQVIHLQVRDSDLDTMESALPQRKYVPGTFQWGQHTIENVGVRYKGNSSSMPGQQHKRSFLIKFNEFKKGRTFLGLQRVALDNGVQFGSLFSEPLITSVLRDLDIKAARCNFAKLYVNGRYEGVYVNVERIDSVFVQKHFADGGGALYKVDEGGAGANWGPLPQHPAALGGRLAFEPKSKAARSDARDVLELISKVNETPADDFTGVMEETLELDAFMQTMAVMLFAGAFDQLTGWNPHNYCLYREPHSKRWYYLPFDLDVGFADNAFGNVPVIAEWNAAWPIPGGPLRPLIERIVHDPQLLARYRRSADEILEKYFRPQVLLQKIDALHEQIKADLVSDPFPHRRVTNPEDQDYESIVASIKEFARRRYETARAQLDNPGDPPQIVRSSPRPAQGPQPEPGSPSADSPSELHVVAQTATSVTLQWKDNASGEAAHVLQRVAGEGAQGEEFRNYIGAPGADVTEITDGNVAPGQTYRYRVYAVRPTPTGPQGTGVSNTVTVRVLDK
ncbi:MAG: CotH kinase family protein [Pirellulaceae bacterium]